MRKTANKLPWWLEQGVEICPACNHTYVYQTEYRCEVCDGPVCSICVIRTEEMMFSCPADALAYEQTISRQTPKRDFGEKTAVIPDNNNPQLPVPLPNFILPIAVPEMSTLSCCGDVIKICIRYTYYDFCCHACEVIKCYEIKREK